MTPLSARIASSRVNFCMSRMLGLLIPLLLTLNVVLGGSTEAISSDLRSNHVRMNFNPELFRMLFGNPIPT